MKKSLLVMLLSLFLSSIIYAGEKQPEQADNGSEISEKDIQTLAAGNTEFALQLYGQINKGNSNIFFSPLNISTALAMTYAGTRGNTAKETAKVMRFTMDQNRLHPAFGTLIEDFNTRKNEKYGVRPLELCIANALWTQKNYSFRNEFLQLVEKHYHSKLAELDFVSKPSESSKIINTWVAKKTNNMIKRIVSANDISPDTRLMLTSCIYFKARWAFPFRKHATKDEAFHLSPDKTADVPTMHRQKYYKFLDADDFQMIELGYGPRDYEYDFSMLVIAPKKLDGFADFEKTLSKANIDKWLKKLEPDYIDLSMPKFKIDHEVKLSAILKAMGMNSAFIQGKANLSGMTGNKDLFIDDAIHKAVINVDESGTEATASIRIGAKLGGKPPKPLKVKIDRPFIFLIRDKKTDTILFIGRVLNPANK